MKKHLLLKLLALFVVLIASATNAWATPSEGSWCSASSANVYFDNTNSSYSYVSMLIGRQWDWGGESNPIGSWGENFSKISGTNNLYYKSITQEHYTTFCFIDAIDWGWEKNNTVTSRLNYCTNTDTPNDDLGSSTHLYVPASGSDDASVTHTTPASYTALNYTQTLYQCVSENGGAAAKSTATIATIGIATKKLNGNSSTTNDNGNISSGSNKVEKSAARTATVTMTVSSIDGDYAWVGWYDAESGGNLLEDDDTYTYQATAAKTVYARFSHETNHSVTISRYCTSTSSPISSTRQNIGEVTYASITAPTIADYNFVNWSLGSGLSKHSSDALTSNPIRVITNSSGSGYTLTANYTEVLTTDWYLLGNNTAIFPGTSTWSAHSSNMLQKASGHSTDDEGSLTINVKTLPANDDSYQFKVFNDNGDHWWGWTENNHYHVNSSNHTSISLKESTNNNCYFIPDALGSYTFTADWSGASPVLNVTWPTSYVVNFGQGTGTAGTASATYSSTSFSSGTKVENGKSITLTAPAASSGYTWDGWYNASSGGTRVSTNSTYTTTVSSTNHDFYARYTETTYNVSASASPAAGGSVTPTSSTAMGTVTGGDITASNNPGYSFTSWAITTGSGYFGASGTATTSTTANTKFRPSAASTLTATFSEVMRTVGVTVNNTYLGSVSAASLTDVGPATKSAEVTAIPETGATFTRWDVESDITIADGYTNTSNPVKINATAESKTLTAVFTETKHTVTLTTADAGKGTVGSNQSVGQITAVEITATPKSGYMFSKWVKTAGSGTVTYYTGAGTGQVTDASGDEKETTYVCVTGDVTLQATWEPDRSSGYVVFYGNDGKNADGGTDASQTRAWKDGKLYRPTTEESNTSSFTFTAGVSDVDKVIEFKIHKKTPTEAWYGYGSASGGKIDKDISNVALDTDYGNGRLCITMPGSYLFTWDKSTNKLSIRYPNDVYYVRGGFNSWDWSHPMTEISSGVYSATVNMTEANHTYTANTEAGFKVLIAGQYYGKNGTTFTRISSTGSATVSECSTSGANMGLTTDYTGNYTFTYNTDGNQLQITYPTAYKVTYGKGSVDGSASDCSAVDITNGGTAVTSNSTWVKSGNQVVLTAPSAKSGYRYLGWFANNAGTGDAITTNANCTITVNSAAIARYACYAENMSSITVSAGTGGTVSKGSGSHSLGVATTVAIDATPSTGYSWSTWTTSGNASLASSATTKSNIAKADGTNGGSGTITATFTPNHYDVILDVNGGSGDNQTVDATFDAAMPTVQKGGSTPIAARTKTGYNFDGYWANNTGTGTQYYTSALASNHIWDVATNETHIYAKWNAKQSAITFDYQTGVTGYSSSGNITNASGLKGTYDAAMTALTGTMPSAAEGYAFTGFYDATSGGTKYYNADGTSAHTWDKDTDSGTTLYARWERARITALTPDAAQVEPETTVGVTPTISPTPTPTTTICWYVLYGNGNKLSPQPTDMAYSEGKLTFTAPATSGLYKVAAALRTGSSCGGGTLLDSATVDFYVAGSHIVTIDYKYSGTNIAASTNVTGYPLEWSEDITAPDVFGYTFSSWTAGTGVTIKDSEHEDVTTSTETTIKIKAIYEGTLTANYTPKSLIYFKNTLGWSSVYVNFYKSGYWNDSKGSGNNGVPVQNKTMTRLGETDIWYYDYGSDDFTGYTGTKPTNYVSFTSDTQSSAENFWASGTGISVSYPARRSDDLADKANETGFYEATPMFVPLEGQTPITKNESDGGKALYYNSGYWTKYLPGTGYTLQFYNDGTEDFIKEIDFSSADELMPMQAVVDLEANTTYKFQIKRHGDVYLGNSGTMTYTEHGQSTPWEMTATDFSMCRITTTAAGDYTFHFTYSANSSYEYRMRVAVDYPVSDGDYRLVYTDDTRSGRIKPSAIVQKENDGSAIVSFFVRKDEHPVLRIQQASVDGSGNITWNEYPTSGTPTNQITGTIASAITTDTVYNFNLSMNGSGALSVASAEFYSGNYYIRTDAANSKWDNYRTDPDHVMTTSEYLKSSVGYTHYYCHWVNKDETGRKNVKFVIANDYSPCISDTLARETASGTWEHIDTWMEEGGDLKRSANVRFMWDAETNNIARAYVDGAQGAGSDNFLIMLSGDSQIKNEAKTETLTQVYFADNQNWIYEANINAQPNAQIKLISNWGTGVNAITQYFKGTSDATVALIGGSGDTWYKIRLLYDFKTNRLVAAYIPSGTISTATPINADVMFIRSGQGDIEQLTFSGSGDITEITSAYGVLRLNKWTLNNKDTEDPHNPLPVGDQLSIFERSLYWISFPFRVKLNDVFGFGTYGVHWAIQRYDGAARAAQGHFLENGSFWRWMDRNSEYLEPNQGYLLSIDLDLLGESSDVWGPNSLSERIELYFPSEGSLAKITSSSITQEIPEHECTINRAATEGLPDTGNPATSYNRTIFDSHWNVLSVPTYINTQDVTFANSAWTSAHPSFIYTWNSTDNTITAMSADDYEYHAMHSYMVQYAGDITWTASVTEPSIVARKTYEEAPSKIKFRLELQQNDKMIDRTYIVMSNDEEVSANFAFGEDMTKEFNKNKAAIFNYTADHVGVAGNTMPMSEQTTIIPLGLEIPKAGEYTFAIPDGTSGVGVTLIDNETGTRTSLSALDYTVNLTTGTHDGRFVLEISPVHGSTTGIETVGGEPAEESGARKMIIDQKLFIIKGDKMYDARGAMVK